MQILYWWKRASARGRSFSPAKNLQSQTWLLNRETFRQFLSSFIWLFCFKIDCWIFLWNREKAIAFDRLQWRELWVSLFCWFTSSTMLLLHIALGYSIPQGPDIHLLFKNQFWCAQLLVLHSFWRVKFGYFISSRLQMQRLRPRLYSIQVERCPGHSFPLCSFYLQEVRIISRTRRSCTVLLNLV